MNERERERRERERGMGTTGGDGGGAALVTGGSKGLGRGVVKALAREGFRITVVDVDESGGQDVVREALSLGARACRFEKCDVQNFQGQAEAFRRHVEAYGRLDVAVINAGVGGERPFLSPTFGDLDSQQWQRVLRINLAAQMEGCRLAYSNMAKQGKGSIILVSSSGGIYPMPVAPVYATSKAGVVHFVRSLAQHSTPIQVTAFCPSYIDTPMVRQGMRSDPVFSKHVNEVSKGRLLTIDEAGEMVVAACRDKKLHGKALAALGSKLFTMKQASIEPYYEPIQASTSTSTSVATGGTVPPPQTFRKVQVVRLSDNFRKAVKIVNVQAPKEVPEGCVLMRRLWVGVNASDVNFSAGRYFGYKAAKAKLPFDAGFESVGVVVAVGKGVHLPVGMPVATMQYGAFSEYGIHNVKSMIAVPEASPEMVAFLTSGLTASIALEQAGMRSRKTVLVTAAAGGTGQFAVQLARIAGNHVIATCGNEEKARLLRELGASRVVNYKKEDLGKVLKAEYPKGIDLVYDGVGGSMFEAAVSNLAVGGRIIVIGMIGGYTKGWPKSKHEGVNELLLFKSATVQGFFLLHYARHFKRHLNKLSHLSRTGQLKVALDSQEFSGIESVVPAVEHLHSGKSKGKVVVRIDSQSAVSKL